MTSGYRMTEREFPIGVQGFPTSSESADWKFLEFEKQLQNPDKARRYMAILRVARNSAFKVWLLMPVLKATAIGTGVGLIALLAVSAWFHWQTPLARLTVGMAASVLILAAGSRLLGPTLMRMIAYRKTLQNIVFGLVMCCFGFAIARLHLHVFDRLYQKFGRM
jgi:hypothetical protein